MMHPFAAREETSRGRLYDEEPSRYRDCYARDRDRIVHSSAFRRLKHKTQVFIEHEGDYYRTRLTHSIEVAQVARTIAQALGGNPDLAEAVALAHDLGHPPFGHTGEDALERLMAPYGGFDHNAQALRIVTSLERHYAEFDGLNLTWETLEGIAKHNGPVTPLRGDCPVAPLRGDGPVTPLRGDGPVTPLRGDGPVAPLRGDDPVTGDIPYALAEYNARHDLELDTHAGLEAQVAALADDVAYNSHDLHDGLRAELFSTDDLADLPLLHGCFAATDARYPGLNLYRRRHEALRRFFGILVNDVITQAQGRLAELRPETAMDIRRAGRPMVRFSDDVWQQLQVTREFLYHRMYRAPDVVKMRRRVTRALDFLFPFFMAHPGELPKQWRKEVAEAEGETALARIVCDYISGMTDRFALQEWKRLRKG